MLMLRICGAVPPLDIRLNDIMHKDNVTCISIYKLQIMLQRSHVNTSSIVIGLIIELHAYFLQICTSGKTSRKVGVAGSSHNYLFSSFSF
jgi:hypothetical protein